jgi:hypothetical protein
MKRNISPVLVLVLAIVILVTHIAATIYCDRQHRTFQAAVDKQVALAQAEAQALAVAEAQAQATGTERDEPIPLRNRPQGMAEGPVYWAEFYGAIVGPLKQLFPLSILMLLFSLWYARTPRTG